MTTFKSKNTKRLYHPVASTFLTEVEQVLFDIYNLYNFSNNSVCSGKV